VPNIETEHWGSNEESTGSFLSFFLSFFVINLQALALTEVSIEGSNRYQTSYQAYVEAWGISVTPPGLVVASGESFPDALSAVALAGAKGYAFLLVNKTTISNTGVYTLLASKNVRNIIIVGGVAAVGDEVKNEIINLYSNKGRTSPSFDRRSGSDRYATAKQVYKTSGASWSKVAIVVSGENFPDALSISPYAHYNRSPLFLVMSNGELPVSTLTLIVNAKNDKKLTSALIVGGTDAVSQSIHNRLLSIFPTLRIGGANRYETAANCARYEVSMGMSMDGVGVATGVNYPDALSAGATQGKLGTVIMLMDNFEGAIEPGQVAILGGRVLSKLRFYGGINAVPNSVRTTARDAANAYGVTRWDLVNSNKKIYWNGTLTGYGQMLSTAGSVWNEYKPGVIAQSNINTIAIVDVYSSLSFLGRTSSSGRIEFNTRTMASVSSTQQLSACIHEFGHALGLSHNQSDDVMYAISNSMTSLSAYDKRSYNFAYSFY